MPRETNSMEFILGQVVCLRTDPSLYGPIMGQWPNTPENRFDVWVNNRKETFYASQLFAQTDIPQHKVPLSIKEFQSVLTALLITHPSLSALYSLNAARVDFIPYQFRPVLKFMRSDRPRLLIADEVGVGKTIEAGLILRELQSRSDLNSVLVICPKALVAERKWERELKRFDEDFTPLDGGTLRLCLEETDLNGAWPAKYQKSILPFSLFDKRLLEGQGKREIGLENLDPFPQFDLVIVDEAHHLRNSATYLHRGVKRFCLQAKALLFLTATPIQLGSLDLYVLLNLLRPDLILDQASFEAMSEPNRSINYAVEAARTAKPAWEMEALRALEEAASTSWGTRLLRGKPEYEELCRQLGRGSLKTHERIRFIRAAEEHHTFATLINRTRRRDIGVFTTRKAETVVTEFTDAHRQLHNALLEAQARILQRVHGDKGVLFMMTTLRRQAASCLFALAPLIRTILTRHLDDADWSELDGEGEIPSETHYQTIAVEVDSVLRMAATLDSFDPKLQRLLTLARDKQALTNNKMLLFSSFRHTLNYLFTHLQQENVRVGLVHGGISDAERSDLRDRFSLDRADRGAIDLLLSSEVGCEGLDYQFCDCLINYDLPWNPMRIEQRIGRIDRYGQKSETVVIYNMVTPGTVDYDIYDRCLLRIGIFRQALGGSEEVLGTITQALRAIAENLALTGEERDTRLQQLADNEIRLLQEQEKLEDEQAELFGLMLPPSQLEAEVRQASSAWLSPEAIQNLVQRYLATSCGGEDHVLGQRPLKTLRLAREARQALMREFRNLPRKMSPVYREWEKWLKGDEPHLLITFDAECATQNRACQFIMPVHPLAVQAALARNDAPPVCTVCNVKSSEVDPGTYPFVIYQWQLHGIKKDVEFRAICADPSVQSRFLALLEEAIDISPSGHELPVQDIFDALESDHYAQWAQAREVHLEKTARIIQRRRESLHTSHDARMSLLRDQRSNNRDEKIRRMREHEMSNTESEFEQRVSELDRASQQIDILSHKVAFGIMIIEQEHRKQ